jgi:hypothetical protein
LRRSSSGPTWAVAAIYPCWLIYIYRYYICIGLYYIILSTIRGLSWIITIQLILIVGNQEDPIITSHFLEGRQRLSNSVLGSRRTEWSFSSLGTPSN